MGMTRGLLMIALLAVAHLLLAVPTSAQSVDDAPTSPYWLVVEVVVEEDGTSEGTATFGATPGAMDAIADFFSIPSEQPMTREEACRRIAYAGDSNPFSLNAALWREQSVFVTPGECRRVFAYPPGTRLSVFTVTSNERIRFFEEFTDPGPRTLFDVDSQGTPWDKDVVGALIADYGLLAEGPSTTIRITYPHTPDGPETRNASLVQGNTLVWIYSPLATRVVPDMRASAGLDSTTSTTTATVVSERPPPESEPIPWILLIAVAAGAFVAGWIGGELLAKRRDGSDE